MLKYLRIAVTALSLTACVLLLALWWRSYWWKEFAFKPITGQSTVWFSSYKGQATARVRPRFGSYIRQWDRTLVPVRASGWQFGGEGASGRSPNYRFAIRFRTYPSIAAPHWFLVLLTVALAASPWIRWSRRFSLRTLLIATTLVAVMLGAIVLSH